MGLCKNPPPKKIGCFGTDFFLHLLNGVRSTPYPIRGCPRVILVDSRWNFIFSTIFLDFRAHARSKIDLFSLIFDLFSLNFGSDFCKKCVSENQKGSNSPQTARADPASVPMIV